MIELIFLVLSAILLGGFAIIVITTITLADIKTIALEKSLQAHPHSRKWRGVTSLRKSLSIDEGEQFVDPKSIRFAIARFQANPKQRFVEVIPRLEFPQTIRQFFAAYHAISLAPFIKVRSVLNIRSDNPLWPTLQYKTITTTTVEKLFVAGKWILNVTNVALFLYVANIAVVLGQPDFLIAYMSAFGMWLAWSITSHPSLVWRQKFAYLLLAPASFVYFLLRIFVAPFAPLRLIPLRFVRRRVLS